MIWDALMGFMVVALAGGLMLGISAIHSRKKPPSFREIAAFARLRQAVGRVVEDGSRLHVSLGHSGLPSPQSAAALAGLGLLRRLADHTSASDQPPIATSGEATVSILSQDALHTSFQNNVPGAAFDLTASRLSGLTPFSYAAGSLIVTHDENITATVLMGNFGVEAGLLTDAAERENTYMLAASDNLPAQAIMYASAADMLIGEEMYSAEAYNNGGRIHLASLKAQDVLRWLLITGMLVGAVVQIAMGVL